MQSEKTHTIAIPNDWKFKLHELHDFERILEVFDWGLTDQKVIIDFQNCLEANYQTLSLWVLYTWHLRANGCFVEFLHRYDDQGASQMWRNMGALGLFHVLSDEDENFRGKSHKPLFAIRYNKRKDFDSALERAETYTKNFDIEYEKTLRYVIAELLYNTREHGISPKEIPSIIQFAWYSHKREISFIVADLGIGIKNHLRKAYPQISDDASAIVHALKPQVSGTFGGASMYSAKDNAGVGLFISSNIVKRLNANMHIVSGNGVVHVSPTDVTQSTMKGYWPGTFVYVTINLGSTQNLSLQKMMSDFRSAATAELKQGKEEEEKGQFYINVRNYFGKYAEDKESAIRFRDQRILPEVKANKNLILDFDNVVSAPHSFLSALLAVPIQQYGIYSYKKIKVTNAQPEIRETIDYILDENTA
jgi:hypothetical protein